VSVSSFVVVVIVFSFDYKRSFSKGNAGANHLNKVEHLKKVLLERELRGEGRIAVEGCSQRRVRSGKEDGGVGLSLEIQQPHS
jgi:hypothetical protein